MRGRVTVESMRNAVAALARSASTTGTARRCCGARSRRQGAALRERQQATRPHGSIVHVRRSRVKSCGRCRRTPKTSDAEHGSLPRQAQEYEKVRDQSERLARRDPRHQRPVAVRDRRVDPGFPEPSKDRLGVVPSMSANPKTASPMPCWRTERGHSLIVRDGGPMEVPGIWSAQPWESLLTSGLRARDLRPSECVVARSARIDVDSASPLRHRLHSAAA